MAVADQRSAPSLVNGLPRAASFEVQGALQTDDIVSDARPVLQFAPLPHLTDMDVKEVLQTIVARAARYLRRRGLLTDAATHADEPSDGEQLALDALAHAAATGTSIAGPTTRHGRISFQDTGALAHTPSPLCATLSGFSLHARTTVDEGDKPGRERLIKYILRPPVATDRVQRLGSGRVRLQLKRAFGDGTFAIEMDELSLVARLAAMVPPPWQNQVRYSGVLAPAAKWRSRVVATAPGKHETNETTPAVWQGLGQLPAPADSPEPRVPEGKGCRHWPWRYLKARTFGEQSTTCARCQGPLRLRAFVHDAASIHRILTHLNLPTHVPKPAPARGPPYYRGPVRRIRPESSQHSWDL